ncbi:MAG: D-alanyl-D-alanine carboxypeptidase (penicillin-binding protein 5/6) [Reinekea sp.]
MYQILETSVNFKRNITTFGLVAASVLGSWLQAEPLIPAPPQLAATAYLLIDAETGQILVANNEHDKIAPASLTKLMTSYIAEREIIEGRMQLSDETLVSEKAWRMPGSRMFIQEGKMVSIEDLLRGIVIPSGNDASVAMAEHIAGSEELFVGLMNKYALKLGMINTIFANSHGLPPKNGAEHYSTAYDLALLAKAIIYENAEFYPIYSERNFAYGPVAPQPNRNRLLGTNPDVDGLKTGHTDAAGYCLVASATRDGMRLISVVMGTRSEGARAQETQKLLTYGFRFFRTAEPFQGDTELYSARVWGGKVKTLSLGLVENLTLTIARGTEDALTTQLNIDPTIKAPIQVGQTLGELVVYVAGEEVARKPLIALHEVKRAGFFARIWDNILLLLSNLFSV